jgi:uncharacterized membrane protein
MNTFILLGLVALIPVISSLPFLIVWHLKKRKTKPPFEFLSEKELKKRRREIAEEQRIILDIPRGVDISLFEEKPSHK